MGTCVDLSRYQVFGVMGIETAIGSGDVAAGQRFAPEMGALSEGPGDVAGSRLCCLVWPTQVFRPRPILRAWTNMLPDGSERAMRDVGAARTSWGGLAGQRIGGSLISRNIFSSLHTGQQDAASIASVAFVPGVASGVGCGAWRSWRQSARLASRLRLA